MLFRSGSRGSGTGLVADALCGFRAPAGGSVSVDGLDVRSWSLAALHGQCMLLRAGDVVAGTVADNVRLERSEVPAAEVQAALAAVGLADVVRALPQGVGTPLITGGHPLTGRQRARLLAARAIVARPRLLVLDELLDGHEGTLDALASALLDAPIPWTVVVVTHDRRVAARCGRVIEVAGTEEPVHA